MFILPILSVVVVSSITKMQPLVRYALPIYPFIMLIASFVVKQTGGIFKKTVLFAVCVWYAWGSVSSFPHFITYANGLSGNTHTSYLKFIDSNMDWGQSLISLKHYIDEVKPSSMHFSYFGRDNASLYGLPSDFNYGSYKFNEICAFHDVQFPQHSGPPITAISVSNLYYCGYYLDPKFTTHNIRDTVGRSILIYQTGK